ncbi:hypothetical protein [Streptomyces yaizuensis]|uniref:Uncharacterized protein n=1 Tax=Streptomyces yaizuensis TaxID=2989713 RepID=A0ABQ5NR89_9ACTN|nr:hypothetical protein [Streptomyces sp. YSPA8]GLF92893.1 hypothetical protein SYYSPA8_01370 [Streptomyces sp. YSPA8]
MRPHLPGTGEHRAAAAPSPAEAAQPAAEPTAYTGPLARRLRAVTPRGADRGTGRGPRTVTAIAGGVRRRTGAAPRTFPEFAA